MNFVDFKQNLLNYIVFSLKDIQKLYPDFRRLQLTRWQKKGYLQKVVKGYYVFQDFKINEQVLFLIANKIYKPSYVSCEVALYYYGFIPENVYEITSISTRLTYRFSSDLAGFSYQKIQTSLFWGYTLVNLQNQNFAIAEPEKALLDYLYLNPHLSSEADFAEMRFNSENIQDKINLNKLDTYLNLFKNQALTKRVKLFLTSQLLTPNS